VTPAHPAATEIDRVADANRPAKKAPERRRQALAFGLGALSVLFAVLNLDDVEVNWIIATWQTPLIVVIAVSMLVGAAIAYVVGRKRGFTRRG
jgi:uncharacterized integral membrane protein